MCQKSINRFAVIFLALIFAFSTVFTLTGCESGQNGGGESPGEEQAEATAKGPKINSPVDVDYVVFNQITYETTETGVTEDEYGNKNWDFTYSYPVIDGLLNQEVEDKVNAKILEMFEEGKNRELPPIRGIKVRIPEGTEMVSESVNAYIYGNINNILSVGVSTWRSYANEEYVTTMDACTFDLNTGEEITLQDVYCNDVDAIEEINNFLSDLLTFSSAEDENWLESEIDYNYWVKLVAPFETIKEDQKFYISDGGYLSIVIDHNNPEFYVDGYTTISIPFNEKMAFTERFFDSENNIYEAGEPWDKALFSETNDLDIYESEYTEKGNGFSTNRTLQSSTGHPEFIRERAEELYASISDQKEIEAQNRFNELVASLNANPAESYGNFSTRVYSGVQSDYSFICYAEIIYMNSELQDDYYSDSVQYVRYETYCNDTEKQIDLEDVFVQGANVESIIKDAWKKEINEIDSEKVDKYDLSEEEIDEMINVIYEEITGFYPATSYFYFSFDDLKGSLVELGIPTDLTYSYEWVFELTEYDKIGCDNLVFFQ